MKEWTEEEIRNKDLMAACGLYCGVCGLYIATRERNENLKTLMVEGFKRIYGTAYEERECLGCMQSEPARQIYGHCRECTTRDCVRSKGYYSCHQCEEWPCGRIEEIEVPITSRIINRAIPVWRAQVAEHGDERGSVEWARAECERYHCPACGTPLIRGTQVCRICHRDVSEELDGPL